MNDVSDRVWCQNTQGKNNYKIAVGHKDMLLLGYKQCHMQVLYVFKIFTHTLFNHDVPVETDIRAATET